MKLIKDSLVHNDFYASIRITVENLVRRKYYEK